MDSNIEWQDAIIQIGGETHNVMMPMEDVLDEMGAEKESTLANSLEESITHRPKEHILVQIFIDLYSALYDVLNDWKFYHRKNLEPPYIKKISEALLSATKLGVLEEICVNECKLTLSITEGHRRPIELPRNTLIESLIHLKIIPLLKVVIMHEVSLINSTIWVNETDKISLIHQVAEDGTREMMEVLTKQGADLECRYDSYTPLLTAVKALNHDMVRYLLDKGCDVYKRANRYMNDIPMIIYLHQNWQTYEDDEFRATLKALIRKTNFSKLMLKEVDSYVMTCYLMTNDYKDNIEILSLLIGSGLDINAKTDMNSESPLLFLCGSRIIHVRITKDLHLDMVKLLLDRGADVNGIDDNGMSCLTRCVLYIADDRVIDLLTMLLKKGVDPNALDKNGYAALHYVCGKTIDKPEVSARSSGFHSISPPHYQHASNILMINQHSVHPFQTSPHVYTQPAISTKTPKMFGPGQYTRTKATVWPELLTLLLGHGANVNSLDDQELGTPMHYAAATNKLKCIEILYQHGADSNLHNSQGFKPMDLYSGPKAVIDRIMGNHEPRQKLRETLSIVDRIHEYIVSSTATTEFKTKSMEYLSTLRANIQSLNIKEPEEEEDAELVKFYKICSRISRHLTDDWKLLFRELMSYSERVEIMIKDIESQYAKSLYEQTYQALRNWKKTDGKEASLKKLRKILKSCELLEAVNKLDQLKAE